MIFRKSRVICVISNSNVEVLIQNAAVFTILWRVFLSAHVLFTFECGRRKGKKLFRYSLQAIFFISAH